MRTRLFWITLVVLILPFSGQAQFDLSVHKKHKKGFLYFEEYKKDLGTWNEEEGIRTVQFIGYNVAPDPLVITSIPSGCGCTSISWSQDTLRFGDSVAIEISYDPKGKPGPFEKVIFVYNTGLPYNVMLTINGEVNPRKKTVLDKYPMDYGNLHLTGSYHNFGFIYEDQIDTLRIGMYNSGDSVIHLQGITGRPPFIYTSTPDLIIQPKQETYIELVYDARQAKDYGDMFHFLNLKTDEWYAKNIPISINAHILERFPKQTRWRKWRNPEIFFDKEEYDFGKALQGDTVMVDFKIYNNGKKPLIIRKIQPSCGCTTIDIDKMKIKKGEYATLRVGFYTGGRADENMKSISVITNDPARPVAKIFLKGIIVQNPNAL